MFPPLPVHATPLEMTQLDNRVDSWMPSREAQTQNKGCSSLKQNTGETRGLVSPVPGLLRKTPTRKQN